MARLKTSTRRRNAVINSKPTGCTNPSSQVPRSIDSRNVLNGPTENARTPDIQASAPAYVQQLEPRNVPTIGRDTTDPRTGTLILQNWTLQDWTLKDEFAGLDIAGLDIDGRLRKGGHSRTGQWQTGQCLSNTHCLSM